MQFFSSRVHRFIADESGVALIIGAMLGGLVIPIGVTAYYFVQLSKTAGILDTVCERALSEYIGADSASDRDALVTKIVDGLVDKNVVADLSSTVTLVSGRADFKEGDPESDRPEYQLALQGREVGGRSGSSLGDQVKVTCGADVALRAVYKTVTQVRTVKVVAANPFDRPVPVARWPIDETDNGITSRAAFYVRHQVTPTDWVEKQIWQRDDGNPVGGDVDVKLQWIGKTDKDGDGVKDYWDTFGGTRFDSTAPDLTDIQRHNRREARERIAAVPRVILDLHDHTKHSIHQQSSGSSFSSPTIPFPAIKPVCYDKDNPEINDGFGWVIDEDLLSSSGDGFMGKATSVLSDDRAFVGVDIDGRGSLGRENTASPNHSLREYDFWHLFKFKGSIDGGVKFPHDGSTRRIVPGTGPGSFTLNTAPPYNVFTKAKIEMQMPIEGFLDTYTWKLLTKFEKSTGTNAHKWNEEVKTTFNMYTLVMRIDCPEFDTWEASATPKP